ncbi:Sugar fermentation stimulation protein A [compost metagenome]
MDFRLDYAQGPAYVEVKSVTLGYTETAVAAFPDAVTQRGAKHLRELAALARQGVRAVQLYCVSLSGIEAVRPAEEIDAAYASALRAAVADGVEVLAYGTHIDGEQIYIDRPLPVLLR